MPSNNETMHLDTLCIHAGCKPDPRTGAIMTPIYQTSTFAQSAPGVHQGWDYSRAGNPTRDALEETLAALECAKHGLAFSSGLAAEQVIIQALVKPGDRVIVSDDVYGGTGRLFRRIYEGYGIKFEFVDLTNVQDLDQALSSPVRLVWIETPTNPMMKVVDIAGVAEKAKRNGAVVVVDNTFASPIFQQPLRLGAHIVLHSTTKYLGGHSDLIGGALMLNDDKMHEALRFVQFAAGSVPGPFECFMLQRSIKTLAVRMQRHHDNAVQIAEFLAAHSKIKKVYFPGLNSHPAHSIAKKQMTGYSGMISFVLGGNYQDVLDFLSRLKVFTLAESLGGVESLINHPEKMTHASVPVETRIKLGIGPNLLRLSVGIESIADLKKDLEQALG